MSDKLDAVLNGTYEEPEVDPAEETEAAVEADRLTEDGDVPAELRYSSTDKVEKALAEGEIDEAKAIALLDELEGQEPADPTDDDGPGEDAPAGDDQIAGPGQQIRVVKTGEVATVAHLAGNGAVALVGEERPKRTVARHEYEVV